MTLLAKFGRHQLQPTDTPPPTSLPGRLRNRTCSWFDRRRFGRRNQVLSPSGGSGGAS